MTLTLECITEPEYDIKGLRGLRNVTFTRGSEYQLTLPDAVRFCAERNSVLESLREAVAFRAKIKILGNDTHDHITRTAAVYFNDGKRKVAFDDDPDPNKNVIIACAKTTRNRIDSLGALVLSLNNKLIKELLYRAYDDGRVVEVPEENEWPLPDIYAKQPIVKAALGNMTKVNAKYLISQGHITGKLITHDHETPDGKAEVMVVGFGHETNQRTSIYANMPFDDHGHARGARVTSDALKWRK